jgi:hypothetical protein
MVLSWSIAPPYAHSIDARLPDWARACEAAEGTTRAAYADRDADRGHRAADPSLDWARVSRAAPRAIGRAQAESTSRIGTTNRPATATVTRVVLKGEPRTQRAGCVAVVRVRSDDVALVRVRGVGVTLESDIGPTILARVGCARTSPIGSIGTAVLRDRGQAAGALGQRDDEAEAEQTSEQRAHGCRGPLHHESTGSTRGGPGSFLLTVDLT